MKLLMGLVFCSVALPAYTQEPVYTYPESFIIKLTNGINLLRAQVDSCKSYLYRDSLLHKKQQESDNDKAEIIAKLRTTVADFEQIRENDKKEKRELENIIESKKPSFFERYIFTREVIAVVCIVTGYIIGRQ